MALKGCNPGIPPPLLRSKHAACKITGLVLDLSPLLIGIVTVIVFTVTVAITSACARQCSLTFSYTILIFR